MILRIEDGSAVPPYEQIRTQVETMVLSGVLEADFRLPSIRQLAADLQLAPATVARAYSELESAGVVASRRGRGTTVIGPGHRLGPKQTRSELSKAAEAFARRAHQLGVPRKDVVAALTEALNAVAKA